MEFGHDKKKWKLAIAKHITASLHLFSFYFLLNQILKPCEGQLCMLLAFALSLIQIYIESVTKFNLDEGDFLKLFGEQSFVFVSLVKLFIQFG
jgi:hypothetical protein